MCVCYWIHLYINIVSVWQYKTKVHIIVSLRLSVLHGGSSENIDHIYPLRIHFFSFKIVLARQGMDKA